jgi:uncharacterized protein YhjY with autotransporter beta-barrel domain
MKTIVLSRKNSIFAVHFTCAVLFFAATAGRAHAGFTNPPFVQSGSSVTTQGSGLYPVAYFQDSSSAYTVTIQPTTGPTLTLNNTTQVVLVGGGSAVTIGSGSTLASSGNGSSAVQIAGNGTFTNSGLVSGNSNGLEIDGVGLISNAGTITGVNNDGITVSGAGTVNNSGAINGSSNAISLGSGSVTNSTSGMITGGGIGVAITGAGMVTNSGAITGTNSNGISLGSGSVINSGLTSTITASANGVVIQGAGTVTNDGAIVGTNSNGITLGSGSVTNSNSTSLISGRNNGIDISGAGTVTNSGSIYGVNNVNNPTTGNGGIVISGVGSVTNSGLIEGYSNGIELDSSGSVSSTGTITGLHNAGITVNGTGTVTNSGAVSGSSNGIFLNNGSVTNSGTASTITGGGNGVIIQGAGMVTNDGAITGSGSNGVSLGSGTVINSGGTSLIIGPNNGVDISGAGTVTNSGSIYGVNNVSNPTNGNGGIVISGAGTVTNFGLVEGHTNGVEIDSTGSVSNAGTITGLTNAGLTISQAGTVTNSGSIRGSGGNGLFVGGTGTVSNTGAITTTGGNPGIIINGSNSSLFTEGGEIASLNGGASVSLGSGNSTVTILARAQMVGVIEGNNHAGNVFNLDLVGVTPAEAAALRALSGQGSGDITIGNYTYDWTGFAGSNITSISLEQVVDPGLVNAAQAIDTHGLLAYGSGGQAYDAFYDAALTNPEAALNELVGREINQGIDTIGINIATTLASDLHEHLDDLLTGGQIGGINLGGLHLNDSGGMYAMGDTSSQLNSLLNMAGGSVLGGTEMSTDTKAMASVPAPKWGVWVAGDVTLGDESARNTLSGFHSTLGSPTIGVDYRVTPNLVLGLVGSYTTGSADFGDGSHIGSNVELLALDGVWRSGNWHVDGMVGGGWSQFDNQRNTFGATASSSPNGDDIITDATAGYDFNLGDRWTVTPELGLQYTHLDVDSYAESGAGVLDLNVGDQSIDSARSHVGFKLDKAYSVGKDLTFIPELRAQWYHEFLDDSRGVATSLPGTPALGSFPVNTFSPQRDFALVGVGLNTAFTGYNGVPVGMFINYDCQVGQSDYIAHSVNAGIRVDF